MKYKQFFIVILLLALFSLTACSSDETPEATPAPADTAAKETPAPADTAAKETPAPADTAAEATPTPADTAAEATPAPADTAATEVSEVKAQALTTLNLRQGPSTDYAIAGKLPESAEIAVVGRNEDSSWLYVKTDSGDEVWLTNNPELVKVDAASVENLPAVESPPPPYNASNPEVNKVLNEIPLVVHHENDFSCASNGGLNHLLPEVKDGHVIGPHSGDLVYAGDNVLFKRSGGSLQLIRENPIARFEGDKEFLSFTQAMELFEAGEITWTGDFGKPGRGVPGCDPKAP